MQPTSYWGPTSPWVSQAAAEDSNYWPHAHGVPLHQVEEQYAQLFYNFYLNHPRMHASGIPYDHLTLLVKGAVRQFMLATFYEQPFTVDDCPPPAPEHIPIELNMPHFLGRPTSGTQDASERGRIDVYIRPLNLRVVWFRRQFNRKARMWQPMVPKPAEVPAADPIVGPCFLQAAVSKRIHAAVADEVVYKFEYDYLTVAAKAAAEETYNPYRYEFLLAEDGRPYTPPNPPAYAVQLQQLGEPISGLCSSKDPAEPGFRLPQGARRVMLLCTITRLAHKLGDRTGELHFRLIFDQDTLLWRDEYPHTTQPAYVPTTRAPV
ncbi:hypothetical protein JCM10908_003259 [Rhodotorula pacifica]|uniref:uncharacterized protein n=1 Tax=Rhodotorula pacifica TaxID=1495444 RepID=UPI00316C62B9